MSENKVVVHFVDGAILKGSTQDFSANRLKFHLKTQAGEVLSIRNQDLKAVYFVRDFEGNAARQTVQGFDIPGVRVQGKKLAVLFRDGELLCCTTLSYTPGKPGYFVNPVDTGSNNLRIFVVASAVAQVKVGPQAETFAKEYLRDSAA